MRAAGALALAAMSMAFGIAVVQPRPSGTPAVPHGSYCDAALAVAHYQGHDRARLDALLDRSLARAAPQVVRPLRVMRRSPPGSDEFRGARDRFTKYNTDHCCECHAAPAEPVVVGRPPGRAPGT